VIERITDLLNEPSVNLSINIVSHIIIFIGAFYVALYNKRLPLWHITPLWYVGLASLFSVITIVLEFIFGPQFPLSNFNLILFVETLLNLSLAYLVLVMFIATIKSSRKK